MKLTIIPSDKIVYKDGLSISDLILDFIPANVHALQWFGKKGWIEFLVDENFVKPENQIIDCLPDWANVAIEKFDEYAALIQAKKEEYIAQQNLLKENFEVNQTT